MWGNQWWSLVGPLTLFVISIGTALPPAPSLLPAPSTPIPSHARRSLFTWHHPSPPREAHAPPVTGILAIVHLGILPNVYMAVCLPSSLAENLLITALLAWRLRQRHRKSMRAGLVSVGDEAFDRPYERPAALSFERPAALPFDRTAAGGLGAEDRQRPSVELSTVAGLPLNAGNLTNRRTDRGDASLNSAHRLGGSISSSHGSAARRGRLLRIPRTIVRTSAIWHVLFGLFTALSLAESVAQTLTQAAIPATAGECASSVDLSVFSAGSPRRHASASSSRQHSC